MSEGSEGEGRVRRRLVAATLLLSSLAVSVSARGDPSGTVETGALWDSLSNGEQDWQGAFVRGDWHLDTSNTVSGELDWGNRFGQQGELGSIALTHVYDSNWYQAASFTGSTAGAFWPRLGTYTELFRKWLPQGQLVTGFGLSGNTFTTQNAEVGLLGEAIYYFAPFVLDAGYWFYESYPGRIPSSRTFVALTVGYGWSHQINLRYDTGREAYRPIGFGIIATEYASQVASAELRLFTDRPWGAAVQYEYYINPYYVRNGLTLSVIKNF